MKWFKFALDKIYAVENAFGACLVAKCNKFLYAIDCFFWPQTQMNIIR